MNLGELIKTIRKEQGLTIRALSKLSGISNGYINHLETGRSKEPSLTSVVKLARALPNYEKEILLIYGIEGTIRKVQQYEKRDENQADPRKEEFFY